MKDSKLGGMGNTVGSTDTNFCNFFEDKNDAYILGLWCADGYWWSSSVGLSNKDPDLIRRFRKFLIKHFPKERIKFRDNHLFVNSRPLLREFRRAKEKLDCLSKNKVIEAYFAGRFDGDGSIGKDLRSDCRIVYAKKKEAEIDKKLLQRIDIDNAKIYYYKNAKTFCLYISRYETEKFLKKISSYSLKLQRLLKD